LEHIAEGIAVVWDLQAHISFDKIQF